MSTKTKKRCKLCYQKFYNKYSTSSNKCPDCESQYDRLHEGELKNSEMNPNYNIRVVYKIIEVDHDGYCSDPYDEVRNELEETRKFQCPKFLNDDDFDSEGNLLNTQYFQREPVPHGNGYCGLETTYKIKSAKRIHK